MENKFILIVLLIIQFNIFISLNDEKIILENEKGPIGNYTYELWKDFGQTTMTLKGDGKFSCSWNNIGNVLFRVGKRWDSKQTYKEIGKIKVNFEFNFISNNTARYGIYGWTQNPLIEYYIIENSEGYLPSESKFGTLSIDEGNYDMHRFVLGSFDSDQIIQLWSIRNEKRNKGTVSVTEHFKTWEKYGYKLGKLFEVSLLVEGYKGFGNANITKNEIIIE
jgi:endo-1,4-beta-xylanase